MSATRTRPIEIHALSGARALPPLVLVLFHFCEQRGYFGLPVIDLFIGKGYLWVEFFFALSGFILIHVYGARSAILLQRRSYLAFLSTRLARLYPLHLATLLLLLGLVVFTRAIAPVTGHASIFDLPYHPVVNWQTFIANLFLVQAWNLFATLSWNAPAWFVSVEFLLCIFFPLMAFTARGGMRRGLLLIAAGVAGLAALAQTSGTGLDITFHDSVLRGMAGFAAGAGMAVIHRTLHARLDTRLISAAQIVIVGALVVAIYFGGPPRTGNDALVAALEMALIFVLAFDRGLVARVFQTEPLIRLGEWSYAIYLVQFPLIQGLRTLRQYYPPEWRTLGTWGSVGQGAEAGLLILAAIGLGALLTVYIERPANARLRRLITARP